MSTRQSTCRNKNNMYRLPLIKAYMLSIVHKFEIVYIKSVVARAGLPFDVIN